MKMASNATSTPRRAPSNPVAADPFCIEFLLIIEFLLNHRCVDSSESRFESSWYSADLRLPVSLTGPCLSTLNCRLSTRRLFFQSHRPHRLRHSHRIHRRRNVVG